MKFRSAHQWVLRGRFRDSFAQGQFQKNKETNSAKRTLMKKYWTNFGVFLRRLVSKRELDQSTLGALVVLHEISSVCDFGCLRDISLCHP